MEISQVSKTPNIGPKGTDTPSSTQTIFDVISQFFIYMGQVANGGSGSPTPQELQALESKLQGIGSGDPNYAVAQKLLQDLQGGPHPGYPNYVAIYNDVMGPGGFVIKNANYWSTYEKINPNFQQDVAFGTLGYGISMMCGYWGPQDAQAAAQAIENAKEWLIVSKLIQNNPSLSKVPTELDQVANYLGQSPPDYDDAITAMFYNNPAPYPQLLPFMT